MENKKIESFPGKDVKKCQLGNNNNPNDKFLLNWNLFNISPKEMNNKRNPIEEKNPRNINVEKKCKLNI